MSQFWQTIAILIFVALAVGYLALHYLRRRKSQCSCCPLNSLAASKTRKPLT